MNGLDFQAVRCPECERRGVDPVPVVMEVAMGLARGKCPNRQCRRRVWALSDGRELRTGMVDTPVPRLLSSA